MLRPTQRISLIPPVAHRIEPQRASVDHEQSPDEALAEAHDLPDHLHGHQAAHDAGERPETYKFGSNELIRVAWIGGAGGNEDGNITAADTVFSNLRLWIDANHNGISEPEELHTLASLNIKALELDFKDSHRVDEYGNQFRYRAKVRDTIEGHVGRWAWDVWLVQ